MPNPATKAQRYRTVAAGIGDRSQNCETSGGDGETHGNDEARADDRPKSRAQDRTEYEARCNGRHADARGECVVSEDELKVLRQEENAREQREEDEHYRESGAAEARLSE
jgi:hypothetical protein